MTTPPLPPDEKDRLNALRRYALWETPPEASFDRLAALAARLFDVPVALVTLIDEDRQWFKTCQGPVGVSLSLRETPRDIAFCAHTILSREVLVVEDLQQDARFFDNPLVLGEPHVRFYAGAPLVTPEGYALGSLCLVDFQPREFPESQQEALRDLAASVVSEMELRRTVSNLAASERLYRQMFADSPHPMWVFDPETLAFLAVNDTAAARYGYTRDEFLTMTLRDIRPLEDQGRLAESQPGRGAGGDKGLWRHRRKNGELLWVEIASHPLDFHGRTARMVIAHDVSERLLAEEARRQSQERFREIAETVEEVFWVSSSDRRRIEYLSPAYERVWGRSPEELYARPEAFFESVHPADRAALSVNREDNAPYDSEYRILRPDGDVRWIRTQTFPVCDDQGTVLRLVGISVDITESKQAVDALRQSQELFDLFMRHLPNAVFIKDLNHRYVYVNELCVQAFGRPVEDWLGKMDTQLWPPALAASFIANDDWVRESGCLLKTTDTMPQEDGPHHWATQKFPILNPAGEVVLLGGIVTDMTDRITLEQEREELLAQTEALLAEALDRADHDPLTGLLNHRAFHKHLENAASCAGSQENPPALLLLDLDNFKFFNDSYGHLAGDDLLRQVAQALACGLRPSDTLARFGGDEFALLMPGATREAAAQMAGELREAVCRVGYRPPGYDTTIPLTISIGIASLSEDGPSRMEMLEAADARLRVAKSGGEQAGQTLRLRQDMARAVDGFSMLDALVTAVDNKDRYTRKHSEDVMAYSVQIARALGMDDHALHIVEVAALLHDVGKIGIPDAILRKPGRLSEQDFEAIQRHPMMGAIIVGAVPGFEETLDAVRHHHERWDGRGYPFGLRGEETPLLARLMAVADAYSAMTTDRPYRKGMEAAQARGILEEGAGTQWDPACVAAFLKS